MGLERDTDGFLRKLGTLKAPNGNRHAKTDLGG